MTEAELIRKAVSLLLETSYYQHHRDFKHLHSLFDGTRLDMQVKMTFSSQEQELGIFVSERGQIIFEKITQDLDLAAYYIVYHVIDKVTRDSYVNNSLSVEKAFYHQRNATAKAHLALAFHQIGAPYLQYFKQSEKTFY
ncbi:hypothetical protein [Streptococcus plurextorum]|uniref:hypothetical protein n=1 Tax=Streptococcus plurextorum TaxID=456876 RepID=UPI0003FDF3F4|nr:hypothetical protein [Streptococcus plurextorum]